MECKNCGQYYPNDEKQCPWCNGVWGAKTEGELKAVSAVLLRVDRKRSFAKGAVGYALAGNLGALLGLREQKKATFSVTYQNGRTGEETVKVGSLRYNKLMSLEV